MSAAPMSGQKNMPESGAGSEIGKDKQTETQKVDVENQPWILQADGKR